MPVESIKYSIPYVLLVVWFILLFVTEYIIKKYQSNITINNKIIQWASLLGLLFFFGFRGLIGWDWYIYYPAFKDIPSLLSFKAGIYTATRFDFGFVTYMSLVKSIWNNFNFFIFINTLIDLFILNYIIKKYSKYSYSLACLLFIVMGGFYLETDLLRSAKATMLFLISIQYIRERKIVPFILINLVGCMFHIIAILYIPTYFLLNRNISKKVILIIFTIGLTIFLIRIEYIRPFLFWAASILGNKFTLLLEKYLQIATYSSAYGITIGLLERVVTASLILIYYDKLVKLDKSNLIFINSFLIYFIFFFYFAEIKIIPVRIGGMFSYVYWVIYPALIRVIEKKNNRAIFIICFFSYSIIKIAGMTDTILYRYVNVLFGPDDFYSRAKIFDSALPVLFR